MAAKQKPMTKEELRAPDEVEVVLSSFWDKLYTYRKVLIGGVVGLLAIGIVLWFMNRSAASGRATVGDALADALKPVNAGTGEEPAWFASLENVPKPAHFADEAARIAAAEASLGAFATAHGGEDAIELVSLTQADLKLRAGDSAGALAAVDAWLGKYTSSAALPLAHDLKARALLAAGRKDDAIAAWTAAAALVSGPFKAHFLTQVGDLQNPSMHSGGDAAKALASYKEALALLPPEPIKAPNAGPSFGPRPVLEARIALIE